MINKYGKGWLDMKTTKSKEEIKTAKVWTIKLGYNCPYCGEEYHTWGQPGKKDMCIFCFNTFKIGRPK